MSLTEVADLRRACAASAAAYAAHLEDSFSHLMLYGISDVVAFSNGGTQGFTGWNQADSEVIVAFTGTNGVNDILDDIDIAFTRTSEGYVHAGFWASMQRVESIIDEQVRDLIDSKKLLRPSRVLVTGHSLGGALAALYAVRLLDHASVATRLITFGQPRVGRRDWAECADDRLSAYVRVVHDCDCVPTAPVSPYHHTGDLLHLNSQGEIIGAMGRGWRGLIRSVRMFFKYPRGGINDHFMTTYIDVIQKLSPSWKQTND